MDKLEGMRYSKEKDICLFISDLEMVFEELRDLEYKVSDEKKYNYFYALLSDDLIIESNMNI